jgi:hypothetical protein
VPERIDWTLQAQIAGGPAIAASDAIQVDAYDKITVDVAAGEAETIEVQPGDADEVQFLMVHADKYTEPPTVKVTGAAGNAIELTAPLMLVGGGPVSLIGAPQSLDVTNTSAQNPLNIQVIVGRKATG